MNIWMQKLLGLNWRTNLAAVIAFLTSVPQFVTAIHAWINHQPTDWRGAILSVIVAGGFALSKDSAVHSTAAQVQTATTAKAVADVQAAQVAQVEKK